ncbi:hypothetical protein O181_095119 [Austropuccinia psidii MF-1]|uniref:Chromo domain-containing protein n=1 Tax=Austropuccinia psidii MF-1 TaxID=1389203 RepID=A0A9Q3J4H1_9BASI|nr:hypothetical protein [Austropuccinia psidii MF-1]
MHPVLKVAGVVHIWYYMPLCTIYAQKFNGDVFRTQFHLSKSRSQNPTPISKEDSLTHQSGNHLALQELGWQFIQDYSKGHSQRLYVISISWQGIKYFNTPWTARLVHTGGNQSTYTSAGKLSTKLQSVRQVVKEELETAIKRFKKYSDRIKQIHLISNLGTNHAYHLKLPQQWKSVHPVFHVSLLEPVKQSTIPKQNQLAPPPVIVEEQEEWEVAQALDSKLKRGTLWYLVECKGFNEDPERRTWEPASNLTNSPDLFSDSHTLYPDKPGPNASRV